MGFGMHGLVCSPVQEGLGRLATPNPDGKEEARGAEGHIGDRGAKHKRKLGRREQRPERGGKRRAGAGQNRIKARAR